MDTSNWSDLIILWATNIVFALLIFFIGKWIAAKIRDIVKKILLLKQFDEMLVGFLCNIIYTLLLVMVVIAALGKLGVDTTGAAAIVAAAGLAIGFALQGSLSNFASGVMILIFKPFSKGEFIEAGGTAGIVEEMHVFTTALKSPDNKVLIVPNSVFTANPLTNFSRKPTRRIDLTFGVGYGDNLDTVKTVLNEILEADDRILKDPAPTIGILELGDSSVNFAVRPWVKKEDYWDVYFSLHETVKKRFDEAGISIPFPQRDVHLFQEK